MEIPENRELSAQGSGCLCVRVAPTFASILEHLCALTLFVGAHYSHLDLGKFGSACSGSSVRFRFTPRQFELCRTFIIILAKRRS